jgi:pimeloyl-ACP methyl ester carboxylesterase
MDWKEYQSQQKEMRMGENFISYREYGEEHSECVICIHGIPTWGYIFNDLAEKLSKNYRVLVPDLPGYGFSNKADNFDRAIDKQQAFLLQWMNELKIEKATLLAHDIGGGVALRMAVSHEERIEKLCLMNCVCYDSWPIEMIIQLGHPFMKKFSPKVLTGFLKQGLKQGFEHSPSKEVMEGIVAPWTTEEGMISLIRNASSLNTNHTTEITSLLPDIKLPTLLLWGSKDRFQKLDYARRLEKDIPNAHLIEVDKARHWVMLDQPDIVYQAIKKFLDTPIYQNEDSPGEEVNFSWS